MNAVRGRVGHVAIASILLGMVAGLALPRPGDVQAGPTHRTRNLLRVGRTAPKPNPNPETTLVTSEATVTTVETSAPPTTAP